MAIPRLSLRSHLPDLGAGVASGLLFCGSIPSADIYQLAWICLIPCFLFLAHTTSPDRLLLTGLTAGVIACTGRTYWITETLQLYGHLTFIQALSSNLLLIFYLALYWAVFLRICGRFFFSSPLFPWLAASVWVLLEWVLNWLFTGFPWELLGYSQYRNLPLIQLASVTGIYGVSFLLVLVNASLAQIAVGWRRLPGGLLRLIPSFALVGLVLILGQQRLERIEAESGQPLAIGIVQGNIPQGQKWKAGRTAGTTDHYADLTRRFQPGELDLILFPETALPFYFDHPRYGLYRQQMADLARALRTPVLIGSLGGSWEEGIYNRAFLLDAKGEIAGYADKVHLVPFGEYLPLKFIFHYLDQLTAESGVFLPGRAHIPLTIPGSGVSAGIFICYESIFPEISRTLARRGATLLINTTNDAWFGLSAAPHQHYSMVAARAVETGRPIVRAANTGISGLVSPTGRILHASGLFTTETFTVHPVPRGELTFYVRYGDLFLLLCALFLAGNHLRVLRCDHQRIKMEMAHARERLSQFARDPRPLPHRVVVLHGYDSGLKSWEAFTTHLSRCSGVPASEFILPDLNENLSIPELAKKVVASLPEDGTYDLVGHSLGGLVALEIARQGERRVERICALASPFKGSRLARLAHLLRLSLPHLLADMSPSSLFTRSLRSIDPDLRAKTTTFRMKGDIVVREASARAVGERHRRYTPLPLTDPVARHRRLHTDPRVICDIISLLQERNRE